MLVLSRRVGEAIVISDEVCIRITQMRGKRVRLAITAPETVPIHREEVHRKRLELVPVSETIADALQESV